MNINELTHRISEEMGETEIEAVLYATIAGFERLRPELELIWIMLPKFDQAERERLLKSDFQMILREVFDKETGEPITVFSD